MKNLGTFGLEFFFLTLTFLRKLRQSISSCIRLALLIIDSEIILRKFLSLADLSQTQAFNIYKLAGIIVISKHKNLISTTFQVVSQVLTASTIASSS